MKKKRVLLLLVDDDEDDRFYLRKSIERYNSEIQVCEAHNGEEAMRCLNGEAMGAALILLDINMPGLTGFDVLDHIRATGDLAHIPAVMLSTSEDVSQINKAYEKGANAYIVKPLFFSGYDAIIGSLQTNFLDTRLR